MKKVKPSKRKPSTKAKAKSKAKPKPTDWQRLSTPASPRADLRLALAIDDIGYRLSDAFSDVSPDVLKEVALMSDVRKMLDLYEQQAKICHRYQSVF